MKLVIALLIVDLIAVYAYCLGVQGRYPPSHPWSGITLILIVVSLILQSRDTERRNAARGPFAMWVAAALLVIAAGLWTVAAVLGR